QEDYAHYPFRTLYVFENHERRNNTAATFLSNDPPVRTQALLTTREELLRDPLGAIWICPADYEKATANTAYDVRTTQPGPYKRQPEREPFVERMLRLRPLLE